MYAHVSVQIPRKMQLITQIFIFSDYCYGANSHVPGIRFYTIYTFYIGYIRSFLRSVLFTGSNYKFSPGNRITRIRFKRPGNGVTNVLRERSKN